VVQAMDTSSQMRWVAILTLVIVLGTLLVWQGALDPAPDLGMYPGNDELSAEHDRYIAHRVSVDGIVVETDPVVLAVDTERHAGLRLQITDVSQPVSPGDQLAVYGIARPNHTVQTLNTQITPRRGFWYAYLTSFGAGLWVLSRGLRQWYVNWEAKTIERRTSPLAWQSLRRLGRATSRGEDDA